ncbi:hypothetical protein RHECNPAF_470014 [Rhizobium etli CNPAF512]|nr:hypothetical protein RHECNPAF_470014 [Rhizobium etli CNPAF512]
MRAKSPTSLLRQQPEIPSKRRIAFVREGGLGSGPFNTNQPARTHPESRIRQEILCQ